MARAGTSTARRYAEAAFEIAERDQTTDEWLAQLDRLAAAMSDEHVMRMLEDPEIPFEKRHGAFKALFTEREMMPQIYNLVGLILRRRRLESLKDIAREFRRLYNRREGIFDALA